MTLTEKRIHGIDEFLEELAHNVTVAIPDAQLQELDDDPDAVQSLQQTVVAAKAAEDASRRMWTQALIGNAACGKVLRLILCCGVGRVLTHAHITSFLLITSAPKSHALMNINIRKMATKPQFVVVTRVWIQKKILVVPTVRRAWI